MRFKITNICFLFYIDVKGEFVIDIINRWIRERQGKVKKFLFFVNLILLCIVLMWLSRNVFENAMMSYTYLCQK